jgi:hypothetical protein
MPKFLEDKLKREYGENSAVPFKVMNKIGAMHGNQETAKGREMERKHNEDTHMAKMGNMGNTTPKMNSMRIEIHRGPKGKVSGFTVHHHMAPKPASKSGAFMENEEVSEPFGADQHAKMMAHVHEHTAAQLGAAAGNAKESAAASEPEGGEGGEYEES